MAVCALATFFVSFVDFAVLILVTLSHRLCLCARTRCSLHLAMFMVWKRETNTQSIIVIKVHFICNFYSIVMHSLLWKVARQRSLQFLLSDARTVFADVILFSFSHMLANDALHTLSARQLNVIPNERVCYWMEKFENRFSGGYKEFIEMAVFLFLPLSFSVSHSKKW